MQRDYQSELWAVDSEPARDGSSLSRRWGVGVLSGVVVGGLRMSILRYLPQTGGLLMVRKEGKT